MNYDLEYIVNILQTSNALNIEVLLTPYIQGPKSWNCYAASMVVAGRAC